MPETSQKGKTAVILSILFLLCALAHGQARGAIFDEQYDNLPRRADHPAGFYEGLPTSFSLRQFAPLPGDQGDFGTCVAWAASYAARTISESIALNRLNQTETTQSAFSVAHIYRNIRPDDPSGRHGAQIYTALDYMRDAGAVRMLDIERSVSFPRVDMAYYRTSRQYPIADYVTLFSRDERQKPALKTRIIKKSLTEGKPVIIGMNTPDSFIEAREVWRPQESPDIFHYGHALCVTGYDDGKYGGAFEVLNSWGRKWGNGGYIWIPYNVFVNFVIEAYEIIDNIANFSDAVKFDGFIRMEVEGPPARNVSFSLGENNFYTAAETFTDDTHASFTVGAGESAYVYSFTVSQGAGENNFFAPVLLFPQAGVSALLNYRHNEIVLPGDNRTITLNAPDTKYLITLFSKQALDIQNIMRVFISAGSAARGTINKRLAAAIGDGYTTELVFSETQAAFTAAPDDPRTVAALIIQLNVSE